MPSLRKLFNIISTIKHTFIKISQTSNKPTVEFYYCWDTDGVGKEWWLKPWSSILCQYHAVTRILGTISNLKDYHYYTLKVIICGIL